MFAVSGQRKSSVGAVKVRTFSGVMDKDDMCRASSMRRRTHVGVKREGRRKKEREEMKRSCIKKTKRAIIIKERKKMVGLANRAILLLFRRARLSRAK